MPIAENTLISAQSSWVNGGAYPDLHVIRDASYTAWDGKTAYIGFQLEIYSGKTNYGWFYATVANDGSSYTILDYAYNTTPNQGLITKRNTAKVKEVSKNLITVYPNPFTETTNIDLTKLGNEKIEVSTYDMLGRLISYKEYIVNPGVVSFGEEITNKGNYFVKFKSNITSEIHAIVKK